MARGDRIANPTFEKQDTPCVNGLNAFNATSWSFLVEEGEGSYLPNRQTNLVISLSLLFC